MRLLGFLCSLEHGKLYFALLGTFRTAQNNLPLRFATGEGHYSEVVCPKELKITN
jgi:hypothetical protein